MNALDAFAGRELWVNWKTVIRNGKPTKVPFSPVDRQPASSTDASTWGTRDQAERGAVEFEGVGIMLAALGGGRHLGGVDLDSSIDDDGNVAPWAREIVELLGSYTEVSPSGRGLKVFFEHDPAETLADDVQHWRKAVRRSNAAGGKDHGIELYLHGRYFTVTANLFETYDTVRPVPLATLRAVQAKMEAFAPSKTRGPRSNSHAAADDEQQRLFDAIARMPNDELHWEDWNTRGMAIYAACGGAAWGYAAFLNWSAKSSKFDRDACDERWDHWRCSPPDRLSAGTIWHHAGPEPRQARKSNGHDRKPAPRGGDDTRKGAADDKPPDEATTFAEIARLAKLNTIAYQRQREAAAEMLDLKLGVLDRLVQAKRDENASGGNALPEIVPWDKPVDGAELLDELAVIIKRHVAVPTRGEDAVALWILHVHCLDAADISPRLAITSATPECGKSTLLKLVTDLVPRPIKADGTTAAAIYRAVKMWHPTLLLDEADTYLPDNEALRGVLDSGHERGGCKLICDTDDNVPTLFPTWCAMAIALIGKLHPSIVSRSIHIELQRLLKGQHVERYRRHKKPYADVARQLARWAADNADAALRDADPDMPEKIGRNADNWRLLVAIADRAGGHWAGATGKAREAALTLNQAEAGQTVAIMLLADIHSILIELGEDDRVSSAELAKKLGEMEGRPWPEFGRTNKPITTNAIARLLKPFHVAPAKIRFHDLEGVAQGYRVSELQVVFDRWLPPLS